MFYDFSLIVPAGTPASDPAILVCPLCYGIIHKVTLFWWPGPHGLVFVTINRALHQFLPTNPDEAFHYDNTTQDLVERLELLEEPYQIELKGWSPDCDYDHEVKVGIGILPPESFPEYQQPTSLGTAILQALHLQ